MIDQDSDEHSPPEAFAAVGNEIRIDILRALWFHEGESVPFSELYELVNVDDTGQFNYHLNKLLDHFVKRSDDGYRLRNAGREIVLSILSSIQKDDPLETPVPVDFDCYSCCSTVHAWHHDGWIGIECESCERIYAGFPTPLAGLNGRTASEVLEMFDQRVRRLFALARRDICPNCTSQMTTTIQREAEPEPGLPFVFKHLCEHCSLCIFSPPGTSLLECPDVISFYHQHNVDLFTIPYWEIEWIFNTEYIEVLSHDPLEFAIHILVEQQQLDVLLDESGSIRSSKLHIN